jgi:uncharacterized protein
MKTPRPQPLTNAELDHLDTFLERCKGGKAMTIEELDGFFAALIAGPELVMPSEYFPQVFGGEMGEVCGFDSLEAANEILGLLMRHWNTIAEKLNEGKTYVPLLQEDENGVAHGNDWAHGFMRGMYMRHSGWGELVNDEDHGGYLLPVMMLFHEHDDDPKMRPKLISPKRREEIIVHMAAAVTLSYEYFRSRRDTHADLVAAPEPSRRTKIKRNDPCPCGSGKKYKKCCGGATVN